MNGITYYQTRSPYRGDFTKNCSLNGFEIDSNFLNLEGRDIRRMYTRGCTLYAELYNGETISTTIDSCGGGSGSGSCDCEREINYLESNPDVMVTYRYNIEGEGIEFEINVPCRMNTGGITNIGQASSVQIENLVFAPLGQSEPYNSFEITGTYQGTPIHIYTSGALFRGEIFSDSGFQTRIGICTVYTIRGTFNETLESSKENIFRFSIPDSRSGSNAQLVFNESSRLSYNGEIELFASTSNYVLMELSDYIGNLINTCILAEDNVFVIGIFWLDETIPQPQEVDLMTSITWSELKSLRDNSQLIPGMQYRIIDYDCTTVQEDTDSAHHPFDIIVFADDEHTLNENARAAEREFIPKTLKLDYNVTVNLATGNSNYYPGRYEGENESLFITQHNDTNYIKLLDENNIIYYVDSNNLLYDSNFTSTGEDVNFTGKYVSKWCGYLNAIQDGVETINGTVYVRWQITSYNTNNGGINSDDIFGLQNINYVYSLSDNPTEFSEVLCNVNDNVSNVFVQLAYSYNLLDVPTPLDKYRLFSQTLSITDESVYFANCNLEAWELKYCLDNDANRFAWAMGSATIHIYAKYVYDNTDYTMDLTANFAGDTRIIDGETYYVFRYDDTITNIIENPFSIDGTGVYDVSMIYYKTNDLSQSPFSNGVLQASKIYVYNETNSPLTTDILNIIQTNITGTYAYTPSSNEGKGVIYYMKDDRNNELPYDFKNIMFKRTIDGSDVMLYTFTQAIGGTISDASIYKNSSSKEGVFENIMNPYYTDYNNSVRRALNQNVFYTSGILKAHTNRFGDYCLSNTFGNGCISNRFGDYCYSNVFGDNCYSNTFSNECFFNVFGDNCYSDTFGDNCNYNTFDDGCNSNRFGNNCSSNVFGDNCHFNVFGDFCYSNTFGDNCNSNTFGIDCFSNTFDDSCFSNRFGNGCYSNVFGDNCSSNVFGDFCSEIIIEDSNQNTIDNIRYIHVFNNVSGNIYTDSQGNNLIQYDSVLRTPTYTQYVGKDTQGNLLIWNPADLVPHPLPSNNS